MLPEKDSSAEIIQLHNSITNNLKRSLSDALKIGQLLLEQKKKLKHGDFTEWIKVNLPFSDRTARNYINLHQNRGRLKTESVSVLSQAYKLLAHESDDPDYEKELLELYKQSGFWNIEALGHEFAILQIRWGNLKDTQDIGALSEYVSDCESFITRNGELNLRLQLRIGEMLNEAELKT